MCCIILCSYSGPIWLDDVDCSSADRFEDCTHRGWGVHNCGASENIGLVCNPGTSGNYIAIWWLMHTFGISVAYVSTLDVPEVTGLMVTAVSHTSITVRWDVSIISHE